jgi:hypothetical protein
VIVTLRLPLEPTAAEKKFASELRKLLENYGDLIERQTGATDSLDLPGIEAELGFGPGADEKE